MDEEAFWQFIALIDRKALAKEDEERAMKRLIAVLANQPEAAIFQFEERLSKLLYNIDGKQWADATGSAGDSDDSFLYVRCFVVAQGKDFYEKVADNPAQTPNTIECWAESLLYVAGEAWSRATGKDEEEYDYDPKYSCESYSNEANW